MAKEERLDGAPRGLTPFGRTLATAGALLLLLGLAFGSFPYLLCALFLLGLPFLARGLPSPVIDVTRRLSTTDPHAGDAVRADIEVRNAGAAAVVSLHDAMPDAFLLESGANFSAAALPPGGRRALSYALRPPRRGVHRIGRLRATAYDPLFLQSARVVEAGKADEVVVHPRTAPAPRIRTTSAWGRTMYPGGDRAARGVLTNDFRELRPYAKGDPLKQVNWKATARVSRDDLELVVNDYEMEGKKVVWVFVDASPWTVGGTNLENHFDELSRGALSVAGHYLDMGHRVGFVLYGSGPVRMLYSDAGEIQERRIAGLLANAEPGVEGDGLAAAVEAAKGFLSREKPLLFVFTLAGRDPDLPRALVSARAFASTGRRPAPIVAVTPIEAEERDVASRIVALREKAQLKALERRGVTVVRYPPGRASLPALLARGVLH